MYWFGTLVYFYTPGFTAARLVSMLMHLQGVGDNENYSQQRARDSAKRRDVQMN